MGSSCSHQNFTVLNPDPDTYTDKNKTWNYRVADIKCHQCNAKFRGIKKTCVDHGLAQPWEIILPIYCQHDMVNIRDIRPTPPPTPTPTPTPGPGTRIPGAPGVPEPGNKKYLANAQCVVCRLSVPVYAENINLPVKNFQSIEWLVDDKKLVDDKNKKLVDDKNKK
jgi:hypothetical protein